MIRTNESALTANLGQHFSQSKIKGIVTGTVACLSLLLFAQSSPAANTGNTSNSVDSNKNAASQQTTGPVYQELKKTEPLPDLPEYTGHSEFAKGVMYSSAPGGTSVHYNLNAKENQQTVLQWYQTVLQRYQWKQDSMHTADGLHASKGDNFVQINVSPSTHKGFSSNIVIQYRTSHR